MDLQSFGFPDCGNLRSTKKKDVKMWAWQHNLMWDIRLWEEIEADEKGKNISDEKKAESHSDWLSDNNAVSKSIKKLNVNS